MIKYFSLEFRTFEVVEYRSFLHLTLNHELWKNSLLNYDDSIIVYFLEYGWPVNYTKFEFPVTTYRNHKSALFYESHVDSYIETELKYNALVGPLSDNPFNVPLATSPLMSISKIGSIDRRTVIDLSFPPGTFVNDGIPCGTEEIYYDTNKIYYDTNKNDQDKIQFTMDRQLDPTPH